MLFRSVARTGHGVAAHSRKGRCHRAALGKLLHTRADQPSGGIGFYLSHVDGVGAGSVAPVEAVDFRAYRTDVAGHLMLRLGLDATQRLDHPLDIDDDRLRLFIISGASPLDPEVARGFESFGIKVVQGYGMTEASPVLASENPVTRKPGSIGKAMPGVELTILNPDRDGVGELTARGGNIMSGYFEDPSATAEILVNGRLRTGDLAKLDDDGFLFLKGRMKNVIVLKNGKNVYPEEIETLISALPYVRENIVFGQRKSNAGGNKDMLICTKIVYDKEYFKTRFATCDETKIKRIVEDDIDRINKSLPTYKNIHRIEIGDVEMAKTTTGKVKRYIENR